MYIALLLCDYPFRSLYIEKNTLFFLVNVSIDIMCHSCLLKTVQIILKKKDRNESPASGNSIFIHIIIIWCLCFVLLQSVIFTSLHFDIFFRLLNCRRQKTVTNCCKHTKLNFSSDSTFFGSWKKQIFYLAYSTEFFMRNDRFGMQLETLKEKNTNKTVRICCLTAWKCNELKYKSNWIFINRL